MRFKKGHLETKLALVQFFLVIPLITLTLFILIYWNQTYVVSKIDSANEYSMQTAGRAFDEVYTRALKMLEKPYIDKSIYNIIAHEYNPKEKHKQNEDEVIMPKLLLSNILYYEPSLTSVTIFSEITGKQYYKRVAPATAVNVRNPDWFNLQNSEWYKQVTSVDTPVITPVHSNEWFIGSGLTLSFSQRLYDVLMDRTIGAIRLDLNIGSMYPNWAKLADSPDDYFLVLDHTGSLVYANQEQFTSHTPLLSKLDLDALKSEYNISSFVAPNSKFSFLYMTHKGVIRKDILPLYTLPILIGVLCFAYVFIFIRWSSKYISKPVSTLKEAMMKGQQKDLTSRCEPLDGEMGDLSDAYNSLMERISELVKEVTQKEQEKSKLSYEVLQSKISPHFLYNTLNAIRWKSDLLGSKEISRSLSSLSSLLRFTIKCTDDMIPFETELEQLENYVQIMRIRYGDDIEINYDIDDVCYGYMCMRFLIQPAVENCYIHAFANCGKPDKIISVRILDMGSHFRIEVEDNGNGLTQNQLEQLLSGRENPAERLYFGIGIGNVRQRLRSLYGEGYDLTVQSKQKQFTRITADIPKIEGEDLET